MSYIITFFYIVDIYKTRIIYREPADPVVCTADIYYNFRRMVEVSAFSPYGAISNKYLLFLYFLHSAAKRSHSRRVCYPP